jgi:hypothetical protein
MPRAYTPPAPISMHGDNVAFRDARSRHPRLCGDRIIPLCHNAAAHHQTASLGKIQEDRTVRRHVPPSTIVSSRGYRPPRR